MVLAKSRLPQECLGGIPKSGSASELAREPVTNKGAQAPNQIYNAESEGSLYL